MIEAVPLRFRIPEPPARPGEHADFSYLDVPAAGSVRRPDVATDPSEIRDLADTMIRVLDDDGAAVGPWNPDVGADVAVPGAAGDGDDPCLRRSHADGPAAEQDLVLHAVHR